MPSLPAIPAAEAFVFTLGCAVIHAQRRRAERLTEVLAAIALAAVLAVIVLMTSQEQLNISALAIAMADAGDCL